MEFDHVVRSAATRQALVRAAWGQTWAGAAPVILVVCAEGLKFRHGIGATASITSA